MPVSAYSSTVSGLLQDYGIKVKDQELLIDALEQVKDRCTFLNDFVHHSSFYFRAPATIDLEAIKPKWNEQKNLFFVELIRAIALMDSWNHEALEILFKEIAAVHAIKQGDLMLPFRIMLVGGKFGTHVFNISALLGKDETISRIKQTLGMLS